MAQNRLPWVQGNKLELALPLTIVHFTDEGKVVEDYIPQSGDEIKVYLQDMFCKNYEFTPTIVDDNVLHIVDNGTLPVGSYSVLVTVKEHNGGALRRSKWNYIIEVYDSNEKVVDFFDDFPDYVEGAIVENSIFYFVGGGGGGEQVQSDWNETDNTSYAFIKNKPKPSITTYGGNVNVGYNNTGSGAYPEIKHAYDTFKQPVLYVEREGVYIPLYSSDNGSSFRGSAVKCSSSGSSSFYKRLYCFECTQSSGALYVIDCYQKPDTGIPATDLASSVQTSLGNADSAVQPAAIANMEVTTNKVTSISTSSTNTQYPSAKCVFDYAKQKPTFATLSPTALTHELEATLQCGYDYFVDGTVDTCEFILPESPDEREISIIFTTDTNPAITITANNSDHIYVNEGFGFEANSTYEMNIRSSGGTYDYYIVLVKMEELV